MGVADIDNCLARLKVRLGKPDRPHGACGNAARNSYILLDGFRQPTHPLRWTAIVRTPTPRALDRAHAYLDGLVSIDTKYLEVVKTYGRWVNELGDVKFATLPFTTFETYRENVDGKYWFPDYERADVTLHLKDGDFPVRLVIKWSDFKPLPATASGPAGAPAASPSAPEANSSRRSPNPRRSRPAAIHNYFHKQPFGRFAASKLARLPDPRVR